MKFIQTIGDRIIIVRVPVYTSIVLYYVVPEITVYELRKAALEAVQIMNVCLANDTSRTTRVPRSCRYLWWLSML